MGRPIPFEMLCSYNSRKSNKKLMVVPKPRSRLVEMRASSRLFKLSMAAEMLFMLVCNYRSKVN